MTKISRWAEHGSLRVARPEQSEVGQTKFGVWSPSWRTSKLRARLAVEAGAFALALIGVGYGTMLVKESRVAPPLSMVVQTTALNTPSEAPREAGDFSDPAFDDIEFVPAEELTAADLAAAETPAQAPAPSPANASTATSNLAPEGARWFNGRPIRVKGVLRMRVTAYSPDERSCGDSADGITATLHSVETNNFQLVAADPRVLKYGSLLTVPGYAGDQVVPVLDCGGKIKGSRLDLLYSTHEEARKWGNKVLAVTVWEYADGKPATNPRKAR